MTAPTKPGPAKKLGTLDVWALGVGIVICGQFFGWNHGLDGNGPVAMLLASFLVCVFFVGWLLGLAELSVAMPLADGPLEYGRRAAGPVFGFVMAWSMVLASQFGAIATAIAAGNYVAFLLEPANPDPMIVLGAGLGTVVLFFLLQAWGVKEQSWALILMTFAALGALLMYWGIAASGFSWHRVLPSGSLLGPKGWKGVADAIPYALWWLIIIECVALAAEECRLPARNIPSGLLLAILTVVVMVVLTLGLGCGAMDWETIKGEYPLGRIVHDTLGSEAILLPIFGVLALFGLLASYHGLLYSASLQMFALGRAGFLPRWLGWLHAGKQTPVTALLLSSLLSAGFVVASLRFAEGIQIAILVAGLASLVWYVLAMVSLLILRRQNPARFDAYRAPGRALLPLVVVSMALGMLWVYMEIEIKVLPLAASLYAAGIGYFLIAKRGSTATD